MQTDANRLWSTRIVTFAIAALATASAVYWGIQLGGSYRLSAPSTVRLEPMAPAGPQAVARALGGGQAPAQTAQDTAPVASRYSLVGVVAGRIRTGAALISVDGQDAKPVRVGNLVDNDMVLESVSGRQAVLSSSTGAPARVTLEMPPLSQ
jgi:general secretion pathway protein C